MKSIPYVEDKRELWVLGITNTLQHIIYQDITLRKKVEPKRLHHWTVPLQRVEPFFSLNMIINEKRAPPSKEAPLSETAPGWSRSFFSQCMFWMITRKSVKNCFLRLQAIHGAKITKKQTTPGTLSKI